MNKTSRASLIIIILCISITASAAGKRRLKNLVKNPKFDQGKTVPDNWQLKFKGEGQGRYLDNYKYISLVKDPDPKRGKCIKFDIPKPVAEMEGVKILSSVIDIKRERPYLLSVDAKTSGTKVIVWVEGEYPEKGSLLLTARDFKDPSGLAADLRDAKDPLSRYVQERLSKETLQMLREYDDSRQPSRALLKALAADLNRLIQGENLYKEQRFSHIVLRQDTRRLIEQNPKGDDLIRLNRLLLEAGYRRKIPKVRKKRSYRAQLRCYASSQGWGTYTRIFQPPVHYSVDQVRIKLYAYYPPGTVYFDNVILRELTPGEEKEWKAKGGRKRR